LTTPATEMPVAQRSGPPKTILLAEEWRRYKKSGSREARDQLIVAYSPIVKYVAGRIASRMPSHVEIADLVSYGLGGLITAVERFEPSRGVKFESYAGIRIRGAIIDGLRSMDWVPRSVRAEARKIENAISELSVRLQRAPTDDELADRLSMSAAELDAAFLRVANSKLVALDEPLVTIGDGDNSRTRLDAVPDTDAVDASEGVMATELGREIAAAIEQLPERERIVLTLKFRQELKNTEIGEILGISESRVCQIHTKAVLRVRALLDAEAVAP